MIHPDALVGFQVSQKRLLRDTYDQAYQRGHDNYHAAKRAAGAAALAALVHSVGPDAERRAIALAPAFHGVNDMLGELSMLSPTQEQIQAAVADPAVAPEDASWAALNEALAQWAEDNAWRLQAGESVAWAGEQAGYAENAAANGELLDWVTSGDDRVCPECEQLGTMGPMPLEQWPATPGSGDTECSVGCRCEFVSAGQIPASDTYLQQPMSPEQQQAVGTILQRRSEALNGLMPDLALLG